MGGSCPPLAPPTLKGQSPHSSPWVVLVSLLGGGGANCPIRLTLPSVRGGGSERGRGLSKERAGAKSLIGLEAPRRLEAGSTSPFPRAVPHRVVSLPPDLALNPSSSWVSQPFGADPQGLACWLSGTRSARGQVPVQASDCTEGSPVHPHPPSIPTRA